MIRRSAFISRKQLKYEPLSDLGNWVSKKVVTSKGTFKVSKCQSVEEAAFVEEAAKLFHKHKLPFARVLKRRGKFLWQEFVEGQSLEGKKPTKKVVEQLAQTLGRMHAIPLNELKSHYKLTSLGSKIKMVLKCLSFLEQSKALNKENAARLKRFLRAMPKQYSFALTQRDFSRGNIIAKNGKLHRIIDFGDTCIEIREYDIARTIFNLELQGNQIQDFLKQYKHFTPTEQFEKNQKYWLAAITINKWANRLKRNPKRLKETKEKINKAIPWEKLK